MWFKRKSSVDDYYDAQKEACIQGKKNQEEIQAKYLKQIEEVEIQEVATEDVVDTMLKGFEMDGLKIEQPSEMPKKLKGGRYFDDKSFSNGRVPAYFHPHDDFGSESDEPRFPIDRYLSITKDGRSVGVGLYIHTDFPRSRCSVYACPFDGDKEGESVGFFIVRSIDTVLDDLKTFIDGKEIGENGSEYQKGHDIGYRNFVRFGSIGSKSMF